MRVAGYCRVSTDAQGERGYGLESQRLLLDAEVERRDWTMHEIYIDVASGGSTKRRPELHRAIAALQSGEAQVLMVGKLDRLSRSLLDFANLMQQSQREGWGIVALDIGVDTSTANGELIANIIMALAQWERRIIGQRTKDALAVVAASGKTLGRPRTVSDDTVAMIRVLRDNGASYMSIARTLQSAGIPTGQGGWAWYPSTVRAITQRGAA